MTTNIERAADVIDRWSRNGGELNSHVGNPDDLAQALADAGLLMPDMDPLTETETESYHEIQVRRFPGDIHWRSHFQGTESDVNDFWELNDQLLAIPSEYKRVVHVTTTKAITPIAQEHTDV